MAIHDPSAIIPPEPPARPAPHPPAPPASGTPKGDPVRPQRLLKLAVILAVIFGLLLVIGLLPRLFRQPQLKSAATAQKDATPTVNVAPAQAPPPSDVLTLPGNIQAIQQTAITAQASGYIKKWLVDIGDRVHAGQVLATISTPEVDQSVVQANAQLNASQAALAQARANVVNQQAAQAQADANLSRAQAMLAQARTDFAHAQASLAQAQEASAQQRAQVAQAQANLNLARVTAQRYQNLLADGAIDQQTTDQAVASYQSNLANVQALQAALRASLANVVAFRDAVYSSQANVKAYIDGVRASRATVVGVAANVASYRAAVAAAQENVRSNQANVARSVAQQSFQNVTAPFAGVVTARNVDNGALISAAGSVSGSTSLGNSAGGNATGSASPGASTPGSVGGTATSLFSIAQTDTLRVFVNVPQTYANAVPLGQVAQILVPEMPMHPFLGRVTRNSVALDAASRTLVTQINVPNRQYLLRPGTVAQVRLRVPHPPGALLVPDSALLTNAAGPQVLIVTQDNRLHFQPVTIGRDYGQVFEAMSGLRRGQMVVTNPNDSLHEGQSVHAVPAPPPTQGG